MKKQKRARAVAIAAASLGLVFAVTVSTQGTAQAAVGPNVAGDWSCQVLGPLSSPSGAVLGQECTGAGTDPGSISVSGGAEYLCQAFTAVRRLGIFYSVTGTDCVAA